jgi:isoleucyl-tRNA synthetase
LYDPYVAVGSEAQVAAVHHVYAADYVTDSDGTGVVHTAPEFGEEDFQT